MARAFVCYDESGACYELTPDSYPQEGGKIEDGKESHA